MDKVLEEIKSVVNQCLGFLGTQSDAVDMESDFVANIQAIAMQIVATIILFLIVRFFLWKKITNLIDRRQEIMQKNINDAKQEYSRAHGLALERDKEYQEAKEEARKIIDLAVKESMRTREQIVNDAKEEARRRLDNADDEIKSEIEKSKKEVKDAIVDVAFLAAEKIVKREIDKEKHRDIVKEFIEEVGH